MTDDPTIYDRVTHAEVLPLVLETSRHLVRQAVDNAMDGLTPAVVLSKQILEPAEAAKSGWLRQAHDLLTALYIVQEAMGVQEDTLESSDTFVLHTEPVDRVALGSTILHAHEADTLPAGTVIRAARSGVVYQRLHAAADGALLWRAADPSGALLSEDLPLPAAILAGPPDPEVEPERVRLAENMTRYTKTETQGAK